MDFNDRVVVLKPSRFGHDYKVAEDFKFFLGHYSLSVVSYLELHVVWARLWNNHPGEHRRVSNFNEESFLVSSARSAIADMAHKPLVYFCVFIHLKK